MALAANIVAVIAANVKLTETQEARRSVSGMFGRTKSDVWDRFTVLLDSDDGITSECIYCGNKLAFFLDRNSGKSRIYATTKPLQHLKKEHNDIWLTIASRGTSFARTQNQKRTDFQN